MSLRCCAEVVLFPGSLCNQIVNNSVRVPVELYVAILGMLCRYKKHFVKYTQRQQLLLVCDVELASFIM